MIDFFNLCLNEFVKIIKKKSTLVFIIFVIIFLFISVILTKLAIINYNPDSNSEIYKDNNMLKSTIQNINDSISTLEKNYNTNNYQKIELLKIKKHYYQYAFDNNIILFPSSESTTQNYWKFIIIQHLIQFKSDAYNLQSDNNKLNELNDKVDYLTSILKKDDYDSFLEYMKDYYNEQYNLNKISQNELKLNLYMLDISKEYQVTKYNCKDMLWKYKSQSKILSYESQLINNNLSVEDIKDLNNKINLEKYRLKNNINSNKGDLSNYNDLYIEISENLVLPILALYLIILASTTISGEFSKGTIKHLFITPNKRWKILLSKLVTLLIILIVASILSSLAIQLLSNVLFGEYKASDYIYMSNNKIISINSIAYNVLRFLVYDINIFIYMLFAITLSTATKDSVASVSISTFVYTTSTLFIKYINDNIINEWIKFIPFNNFNLLDKIFSNSSIYILEMLTSKNQVLNSTSLQFSGIYILVVCVLLCITVFNSFKNKEIN